MNQMDISVLLRKAEELKALFILGQRVIPFLEELFLFVSEIKPLLDEINISIQDNLKKMPSAAKQLSKVTEATEMATTEIMDIVDGIIFKTDVISSNLEKIKNIIQYQQPIPLKIIDIISSGIKNNTATEELANQLIVAINELKNRDINLEDDIFKSTTELINTIKDDSTSIMMSLQVQDITSQQIAAVNHLLETIQNKLSNILHKFQNSEMSNILEHKGSKERTNVTDMHRKIAFDPNAVESIDFKESRQDEVDALLSQLLENKQENNETKIDENISTDINEDLTQISQDDIDALFGEQQK